MSTPNLEMCVKEVWCKKKRGGLFGDIILFFLTEDAHQIKIVRRDFLNIIIIMVTLVIVKTFAKCPTPVKLCILFSFPCH